MPVTNFLAITFLDRAAVSRKWVKILASMASVSRAVCGETLIFHGSRRNARRKDLLESGVSLFAAG